MTTDNPAGRLLAILERAKRTGPPEDSALACWCKVWHVPTDPNGYSHVMRMGVEMMQMARQTRASVESLEDDDPELVLQHFVQVESVLNNFTGVANMQMAQFMQGYGATAEHSLRLCSSLLHRRMPEPTLEPDTIEDLSEKVSSLAREVDAADDLPDDLRQFISERLRAIAEAVDNYEVSGFGGVENATDQLIGSIAVRNDIWGRVPVRWVHAVILVGAFVGWTLNTAVAVKALTAHPEPQQQRQLIVNIYQESTGQRLPELEQGQRHREHEEILDGELVEDDSDIDPAPSH